TDLRDPSALCIHRVWEPSMNRVVFCRILFVLFLLAPGLLVGQDASADDKLPAPKKDVGRKAAPKNPTQASFATMLQKRDELGKKLTELQAEFQKADQAGQKQIQAEFEKVIGEFKNGMLPKMVKVATQLYLEDEKNEDAEGFLLDHLEGLFGEMHY